MAAGTTNLSAPAPAPACMLLAQTTSWLVQLCAGQQRVQTATWATPRHHDGMHSNLMQGMRSTQGVARAVAARICHQQVWGARGL